MRRVELRRLRYFILDFEDGNIVFFVREKNIPRLKAYSVDLMDSSELWTHTHTYHPPREKLAANQLVRVEHEGKAYEVREFPDDVDGRAVPVAQGGDAPPRPASCWTHTHVPPAP